jgi:uncharacterized Tic20 family protein
LFELEEVVDKHASEYLGFRIKLVFWLVISVFFLLKREH